MVLDPSPPPLSRRLYNMMHTERKRETDRERDRERGRERARKGSSPWFSNMMDTERKRAAEGEEIERGADRETERDS